MRTISIRGKKIGGDAPCFIIAEVGINHNNELETAKKLIDVAADAGCDAVKFQAFKAKRMYPRSAGKLDWKDEKGEYSYDIFEANERFELPDDWWGILYDYAHRKGLVFFASASDEKTADLIEPYTDLFKTTSFAITHLPLLKHLAMKRKPLIFSTGTATFDEIEEAYGAVKDVNDRVIILHCVSEYPTPLEHVNLAAMDALAERFPDAIIGWSDHTSEAADAPVAAIAHGAKVIEKHITLDRSMQGPDHFFALEPAMLQHMVRAVRDAEAALERGERIAVDSVIDGHRDRKMTARELYLRSFARQSVMTTKALKKGSVITKADIAVLRNGTKRPGLEPKWYDALLSEAYVLTRDCESEHVLKEGDVRKLSVSGGGEVTVHEHDVRQATAAERSALTDFLVAHGSGEPEAFPFDRRSFFGKRADEFLSAEGKAVLVVDDGILCGALLSERLAFDSGHFGVETYRIRDLVASTALADDEAAPVVAALLAAFFAMAASRGASFIHCKIGDERTTISRCLEQAGFTLISHDLTFVKECRNAEREIPIRSFTREDVERIVEISNVCYTKTRFHVDPRIPREKADGLQASWARNCCVDGLADDVLVVELDGRVAGYIACSVEKGVPFETVTLGRIILFGVDPAFQRRGLGTMLLEGASQWFFKHGCSHIAVETQQRNAAAIRAYTRQGFRPVAGVKAYHWWRA